MSDRRVPRFDDTSAELPTWPPRETADPCSSSREAPFTAGEAPPPASPAGPLALTIDDVIGLQRLADLGGLGAESRAPP